MATPTVLDEVPSLFRPDRRHLLGICANVKWDFFEGGLVRSQIVSQAKNATGRLQIFAQAARQAVFRRYVALRWVTLSNRTLLGTAWIVAKILTQPISLWPNETHQFLENFLRTCFYGSSHNDWPRIN
ncbi:MAG: hypothetical protein AAFV74_11885 [Pseudomonadota bacterium]